MNLRNKYQEKLQRAIAQNDFSNAIIFVKALDIINRISIGESVELGNKEWELTLKNDLEEDFIPDINKRLSLSASSIETYIQCPLKYRFQQIDKIPPKPNNPTLIFGSIIHKVLENFHETKGELSEQKMIDILNKEWESVEFEYSIRKKKFKEQAVEILKRYVEICSKDKPDVLATEYEFVFDIDDVRIRGKIDRIDNGTSGKKVVDYKTSKKSSSAKDSIQLAIYCIFLQEHDKGSLKGIPESATLYFLRDKKQPKYSHSFTKPELVMIQNKIKEVAQNIRASYFEPITGVHCEWCDYKNLACPAWES
ncbi:MAG: hypothetical protein CMG75_10440 [Candidatus Marinimicrobia bacterium]|nr:hypothetical protein [Candidatus Neomarinimicrobiota bacterium]|tara:strand:- start:18244 stop:19170 length:927 start_codon:yes stop_codon:yes gene_type:complete